MLGAIVGDILAHPYESWSLKATTKQVDIFLPMCKFTDDSVLTIAVADSLLNNAPYEDCLKSWYKRYPNKGYGGRFSEWAESDALYINDSYSNGCAMRVSPIAYAFNDIDEIREQVKKSIYYTHNHMESLNGAFAIAGSIFLARSGKSKDEIKNFVKEISKDGMFNYLDATVDEIKKWDKHEIRCNITIPQAIVCFLNSTDYEDCIRNAIYSEGDCDTIAAMSGAIAEAYYKEIPSSLKKFCSSRIPLDFQEILLKFKEKYKNVYY